VLGVLLTAGAAAYALIGQSAPDFALRAIAGGNVRLSEHRGEVVILTFWSSRCASCVEELAALDRNARTYGAAGLKVFGINVDDDSQRAVRFADARSVAFPMLLDPDKEVSRRYRIDSLPTTILIDRTGAVRHMHRDLKKGSESVRLHELRALLNE
jgi:peroxiredoxin